MRSKKRRFIVRNQDLLNKGLRLYLSVAVVDGALVLG